MIRVNLIGEPRRPVAARQASSLEAPERAADWALAALLLLGLLAAGGHWLLLEQRIGAKKEEVAAAQEEVDRLAPIIREVEEFKQKRQELQRKKTVIQQLRANQRGPVHIMDQVSRALPELLWLTRMDVRSNTLKLTGQAFNTNAVANFLENLDRVREFQEPVLRDTARKGQVYTFVIDFTYSLTPGAEGLGATAAGGP